MAGVRRDGDPALRPGKQGDPEAPRKASTRGAGPPVPQTDTGGRAEHAQAHERTVVKELGKTPP